MDLFVELETLSLVTSATNRRALFNIEAKRGDALPLTIRFLRDSVPVRLDAATVITLAIKEEGKYDDEPLVLQEGFAASTVEDPDSDPTYTATPSLNTTELNALFLINGDSSDDIAFIDLMAEITWEAAGDTGPTTTNNFTVRMRNDVFRGTESTPSNQPSPSEYLDTQNTLRGIQPIRSGATHLFPASLTIVGEVLDGSGDPVLLEPLAFVAVVSGVPTYSVTTGAGVQITAARVTASLWEVEFDIIGAVYSDASSKTDPTGLVLSSAGRTDITITNTSGVLAPQLGDVGQIESTGAFYRWNGVSWESPDERGRVTVMTDIHLPTWDKESGTTHTDWLYKEAGFFGIARYMATHTPYENSLRELPHICYSHDGLKWFVPDGATPRVIPRKEDDPATAQFITPGDSDLVELSDSSAVMFHLWTTETGNAAGVPAKNTVFAVHTTDGINWIRQGVCFDKATGGASSIISPAVITLDNGHLRMYYTSKLDSDGSYKIWYRDCVDPINALTTWTSETLTVLPYETFPRPHHLGAVKRTDDGKIYLIPTLVEEISPDPNRHYHGIFVSDDGVTFTGDGLEKIPRFPDSLGRGYYRSGFRESTEVSGGWDALIATVDSDNGLWGSPGDGPGGRTNGRIHLATGLMMDGEDRLTFVPSGQKRSPLSGTAQGHKIKIDDAGDAGSTKDSLSWEFKTEALTGLPPGESVRVQSYNDQRLGASGNKSSGLLEIFGVHGATGCYGKFLNRFPAGGIESVDVSGGGTTRAQSYGGSAMTVGITAVPDNLTIVAGDVISQPATGTSFTVHSISTTNVVARDYTGTVVMTNQQPIEVNDVAATNGGVTVKVSTTVNPPVDGINVYLIPYIESVDFQDISGGYFEIHNASSTKFDGKVTFDGAY